MILQPAIIRIYKAAGIVALSAILIGLLSFLVVNVFYFFNNTWIRPVVLSPTHQKVIEASSAVADARLRASQLDSEKLEIAAELAQIDRIVATTDVYLTDLGPLATTTASSATKPGTTAPMSVDAALLRRQIDLARLQREEAVGKREALNERNKHIDVRIAEQEHLVERLSRSPYLRAVERKVVIVFIPYSNLPNVSAGTKLYGCSWGLVLCRRVGRVTTILDGEVQELHPHDETMQRGVMAEIELTSSSAGGDKVLFAGSKPLWLF